MIRKEIQRPFSWGRFLIYFVLVIGAIISVLPFIYMIMSSLKSHGNIITNNLWPWWPSGTEPLQWNNYKEAIKEIGFDKLWGIPLFWRYLINSLLVVIGTLAGILFTAILAAYALTFINVPGKGIIFVLILSTLMIPNDLTLVPKVVMMYKITFPIPWYNTFFALIVPFLVSVFGIFLLRQFFMQIPKELLDAAKIDGAGHLTFLFTIVLPLSKPALVTVALLNFIWVWDSFKWPFLVTRDSSMRVLAVGLQQFNAGEGGTRTELMMAFATLVVVPILVFYFFTQKYFTEGISRTGIKG